ncbi:MAG TPA: antitoxin Xre/MbcA/ParS toxin-binding domain-containing protein [Longimicrobium sp.]|jgi:putative toxin-antitoxin system antitoxin component (TIGR02293 family)|uniref:type II RES/Xre toxin-antitoxin system antitoxin n=1 Tax=Longimicrobium sp. TaxID=2029185 RepID=UPI002EDB3662
MEWIETARALGGTAVLGDDVTSGPAFIHQIEEGLPTRVLAQLKRYSHLSDADLTAVIPRRTFSSFRTSQRLTPEQSDRVARTAGIAALAQRVFGDPEIAREWLLAPNPALEHQAPLRMLRTGSGARLVEAVLIRIEHGVYE